MTTINTQEDFLQALKDNPQWRRAVQAQLIDEDHLQTHANIDVFVAEQRQLNDKLSQMIVELQQFNAEQRQFNAEQSRLNAEQSRLNEDLRAFMRRTDPDVGDLKGIMTELEADKYAANIADEMGLEYVRSLERGEIVRMSHQVQDITRNERLSFANADLVIEAKDGDETCYIAVEASFNIGGSDTSRALRNAELIAQVTGCQARAAVAGFRHTEEVREELSSRVHWRRTREPRA